MRPIAPDLLARSRLLRRRKTPLLTQTCPRPVVLVPLMKVPTNQVQLFDELGYWGPLPSGAGVGDFASQSPEASSVGSSLLGAGGGGGVGSSGCRRGRDSRLLSAALPGVSALSEPGLTDLARLAPAEPDKPPPTATPALRDLKALICLAVFKIRSFAKTLAPGISQ